MTRIAAIAVIAWAISGLTLIGAAALYLWWQDRRLAKFLTMSPEQEARLMLFLENNRAES